MNSPPPRRALLGAPLENATDSFFSPVRQQHRPGVASPPKFPSKSPAAEQRQHSGLSRLVIIVSLVTLSLVPVLYFSSAADESRRGGGGSQIGGGGSAIKFRGHGHVHSHDHGGHGGHKHGDFGKIATPVIHEGDVHEEEHSEQAPGGGAAAAASRDSQARMRGGDRGESPLLDPHESASKPSKALIVRPHDGGTLASSNYACLQESNYACIKAEAALDDSVRDALALVEDVTKDALMAASVSKVGSPVRMNNDDVRRYILLDFATREGPRTPCQQALTNAPPEVQQAAKDLQRFASVPTNWDHGISDVPDMERPLARAARGEHLKQRRVYRDTWNIVAGYYSNLHANPPLLLDAIAVTDESPPEVKQDAQALREKLPTAINPCKRFIISISTVPSRLKKLGFVIRSMKWQEHQPDKIYVGLAPFATRLKTFYEIPPELLEDPMVQIVTLPVDFGPLSKLMGAIYGEDDPDTCIMTVDDDAEPQPHMLRHLLTWASLFPKTLAVGFGGWNHSCIVGSMPLICGAGEGSEYLYVQPSVDHMCQESTLQSHGVKDCMTPVHDEPRGVQVLQGVRGVLYRRGMFQPDFADLPTYIAKQRVKQMVAEVQAVLASKHSTKGPEEQRQHERDHQNLMAELAHHHPNGHHHPQRTEDNALEYLLAYALNMLHNGTLSRIPNEAKWRRLSPPTQTFFVDDVYIAAYLSWKGTDKIAVPRHPEVWKLPVRLIEPVSKPWDLYLKPHHEPGEPLMTTVDSLHSAEGFNSANAIAARFFRYIQWW